MKSLMISMYQTDLGKAFVGDSLKLLADLPDESVDLVMTSPPFALVSSKGFDNASQESYTDWLSLFIPDIIRILKDSGSLVLDLGGVYKKGRPIRSLYNYRVLIHFCDVFKLTLHMC